MVVEPRFDLAGPFKEGLAQVKIDGKMGYIDKSGTMVIEPRFEDDQFQSDPDEKPVFIGEFVEGLAAVRHALGLEQVAGWGFIDTTGRFVIPPVYTDAFMFSEGLARVMDEGQWGYVDPSGELVIAAKYSEASEFEEGLALVCSD